MSHRVYVQRKLSLFYFIYFATVGTLIPFLGVYLQSLNLNALEISQIVASLSLARLISPILWANLSDRWGCLRTSIFRATLLSLLPIAGFWVWSDYWCLIILAWWLGFFWHAILPSFEALTLQHLAETPQHYSRIRMWGSLGFIVAVQSIGAITDIWGIEYFLLSLTILFLWLLFSAWWVDSPLSHRSSIHHSQEHMLTHWQVLTTQGMPVLLISVMLMQVSHGVYYAFYSILLVDKGYANSAIGALWSLGVIAEIVMFLVMQQIFNWRSSLHFWLSFSLAIAGIRWLMLSLGADFIWILIIVQLFHAVSFALFHSVAMQALQKLFPNQGATQAQAWYSSLGYGVGGILGALIAGYLWNLGYSSLVFVFASFSAMLGCIIVWRYWRY